MGVFDLENDPNEQINIINQETLTDLISEYKLEIEFVCSRNFKLSARKRSIFRRLEKGPKKPKNKTR